MSAVANREIKLNGVRATPETKLRSGRGRGVPWRKYVAILGTVPMEKMRGSGEGHPRLKTSEAPLICPSQLAFMLSCHSFLSSYALVESFLLLEKSLIESMPSTPDGL